MLSNEKLKEMVAHSAFNQIKNQKLFQNKDTLWIGIGSGTTISHFIDILGTAVREHVLPFNVKTICSSIDSEQKCRKNSIAVHYLEDLLPDSDLDIYIDGADEVDTEKQSLKGLGGSSTREKLTALSAKQFYLIIDSSKQVPCLGTKKPVVCEIIPFGHTKTMERLRSIDPLPSRVELRHGSGKMGPVITDNSNFLVDLYFDHVQKLDILKLEKTLKLIPGVVETGIFSKKADYVFIADGKNGVTTLS